MAPARWPGRTPVEPCSGLRREPRPSRDSPTGPGGQVPERHRRRVQRRVATRRRRFRRQSTARPAHGRQMPALQRRRPAHVSAGRGERPVTRASPTTRRRPLNTATLHATAALPAFGPADGAPGASPEGSSGHGRGSTRARARSPASRCSSPSGYACQSTRRPPRSLMPAGACPCPGCERPRETPGPTPARKAAPR